VTAKADLVYVVEDDPEVARVIVSALDEHRFAVERFGTARELLRRMRRLAADLCIVDLGLPDADGMQVVRELQEQFSCAIMIVTGRQDVSDRVLGLELGADDYVVKPFEPRELVARARSILRRTRSAAEESAKAGRRTARFAGWSFHEARNLLVAEDGRELVLSVAEARLLSMLLKRPNVILAREQLLGERNLSPYDRSIDVRISRLRRKLEADPENPRLIKTVYGGGYLLSANVQWETG
jgi:DNA-binding response OmpR family regulator